MLLLVIQLVRVICCFQVFIDYIQIELGDTVTTVNGIGSAQKTIFLLLIK